ncbi:uncharacterized protein [Typha angustifolia]|uniref:uncharacterized protein n=1 Tax=Typha angustifolia TaxID=59011 RepID=UPI003C2FBFA7
MSNNRARWTPPMEKYLVDLLLEYNLPCYRGQNGWTKDGWNKIVADLNRKFPAAKLTKAQIKDRQDTMKKEYKLIRSVQAKRGMLWDHKRFMLIASEDLWESLIMTNPKLRKWQRSSFIHYDAFAKLYEDNTADDQRNSTSIRCSDADITGSEEEQDDIPANTLLQDFPNLGESSSHQETPNDVSVDILDDQCTDPPHTRWHRLLHPEPQPRSHPRRCSDSNEPTPSASPFEMSGKNRSSCDIIAEMFEDYMKSKFQNNTVQKDKQVLSPYEDSYPLPKCIRMMTRMVELSDDEKITATDLFLELSNRQIFLSLDDNLRVKWLRRKLEQRT